MHLYESVVIGARFFAVVGYCGEDLGSNVEALLLLGRALRTPEIIWRNKLWYVAEHQTVHQPWTHHCRKVPTNDASVHHMHYIVTDTRKGWGL